MRLDLSILVVTYNQPELVDRFHKEISSSLADHSDWTILYCDHSPDKKVVNVLRAQNHHPHMIVHDPNNPGFATGVNRLLSRITREWVALVNPDVFGFTGIFWERLCNNKDKDSVTFVDLIDEDGLPSDCYGFLPSVSRPFRRIMTQKKQTSPFHIETGIMAFMFTARINFERVGFLDEQYFLYAEDMDWCYRARTSGLNIFLEPRLQLVHFGSASALSKSCPKSIRIQKYISERLFIKKHYRGPNRLLMLFLNIIKQIKARFA